MNIFASSSDPEECAMFLDDRRLVKMVLESAQLLSTSISACGGEGPYKMSHINHPCAVWTRETNNNYNWLLEHFKALCREYTKRFNKTHKCQSYLPDFITGITSIPAGPLTPFPNCTTFKTYKDTHLAYVHYLEQKWLNDKRPPTWCGYTKEEIKCLGL